ncbi:MAG: carbamoyl-phosphate synthase large subunit [Clostridiales bacterium]|nr:carbamoyl-phosphate synthase large subunit [Clostridiales bacterium]MCD7827395.1 carbamoyl-phosphate synthase large subunit [Clostridiales bacterium]
MPLNKDIKKVLVIGSGPIVIGQAAEFDYAGTQACRVLKNEGIDVVLVNSNPATIMTDSALADEIYLEPLTVETVMRIIEKEKPDSVLAGLGGQTGLTIGMQLAKSGFLEEHGVRLIGTNADAIDKAEDRELFKETMEAIGQPVIPSDIATTTERAVEIANEIGYPVIIRPAFTLGGAGGGVAYSEEELLPIASNGILLSPIDQILVEKYIYGWKEIEFEVMRDHAGNVIAVCSMENFDPVGVHTGDSIVIAPAVTLSDKEYQMLRGASLKIIDSLGIEGGCNCQFALNPESFEYSVIEVNPRVSRSSALASKATGYPIAKVAAKIALGYTLDEIRNDVTGQTCACFEPTLDYVVVKLPKWPFDKFINAKRTLGTQMKATGEVMAIAPYFEAAIMKAVRGAEISLDTLNMKNFSDPSIDIRAKLHNVDDMRLFTVFEALKRGITTEEIHDITKIDEWFINKLKNLADYEKDISKGLTEELYLKGKKYGYTDAAIERISGCKIENPVDSVFKMVDTCGAEFKAETPYFYSTYDKHCEAREHLKGNNAKKIIVLGSGPIRIGQGIEFDYSSVHCVWTLKALGYEVVIINNNPETVSTDFDTADRLYFEPLTPEDVLGVIKAEKPEGIVVAFGGQTAIKLTKFLDENGFKILGTSAEGIDIAEDRERFDALLEKFSIRRPKGMAILTMDEALNAAHTLGYPVLLRPSYVIGGQNMTIAYNDYDVRQYMEIILSGKIENPVLVDKYMMGSELEVDVISDGKDVLIPGIMQHIERAGVHSGDSIAVYPPYNLRDSMKQTIIDCSSNLALALGTKGLVNIQYLIYDNELYVIEVNPRASRTIPYISKVTGVPMVDIATKVMTGTPLKSLGYGTGLYKTPPYFAVKVPVFSFEKLLDANSSLGPEMKSTGEVLGVGKTIEEALFKGLVSAGFEIPSETYRKDQGVYITVKDADKPEVVQLAKKFHDLGLKIYATEGTARVIRSIDIDVTVVNKLYDSSNTSMDLLEAGKIKYIIYTGTPLDVIDDFIKLHRRALQLSVATITSIDTANVLADIIASGFNQHNTELVDINDMRKEPMKLKFAKMQGAGNDFIFFDNLDGQIDSPEVLAVNFCNRHYGIGSDGIVLIEKSETADAKMIMYNRDGSPGLIAGNGLRCAGKYLYDNGIIRKTHMTIETPVGLRRIHLYTENDRVKSVKVILGKAEFSTEKIPANLPVKSVIDYPVKVAGKVYNITCVNVGNPHCVVFANHIDSIDLKAIGPEFENASYFPQRINTEFVRVVNRQTIRMRVWERGNGETYACGTGACASVAAACELGLCDKGKDITVKLKGGDLIVNYTDEGITLTGNTSLIFEGIIEY